MITADGLISLYSQGNPFLAQSGQQAFDQQQEKAKADLQTIINGERRTQQMHPLEMLQRQASTRSTNAAALIQENAEAARPPVADRLRQAMAEQHKTMSELERAHGDQLMETIRRASETAKANGGTLPLPILSQLPQEWAQRMSTPEGIKNAHAMAQAWYDSHPKTLEARAEEEAKRKQAVEVAQIQAAPRQAAAAAALLRARKYQPAGTGGTKAPVALTRDKEWVRLSNLYQNTPEGPEKDAIGERLQYMETMRLREIALRAEAQKAGSVDVGSMPGSKIPVMPAPNIAPTPLPSQRKPAPGSSPDNPIILK